MNRILVGCAAASILAAAAGAANAATFVYTFNSNDGSETATGTLSATDNGDGTFTATSGTINLSGTFGDSGAGTLSSNPNAPTSWVYSPSGFFYIDDQLLPAQNPLVTNPGLLFIMTASPNHEINIFSNGPSAPAPAGTYTLYSNSGENINGALSLTAVPEPASWALMMVGFGGLGAILRRRRQIAALAAA